MNLVLRFKLADTPASGDEVRANAAVALGMPPVQNPNIETLEEAIGEALARGGVNVSEYDDAEVEVE